jgi:hypothetical protein
MSEVKQGLGRLLRRFAFQPVRPGAPRVAHEVNLRIRDGLWVVAVARQRASRPLA